MHYPIKPCPNLLSVLLIMQSLALAPAASQGTESAPPPESKTSDRIPIEASLDSGIQRVGALLREQGPVLLSDLDWFKSMGYLCRRTKTDITREMAKAETNMSALETMRRSGTLVAAHARRIAYTLGMDADALAQQAVRLDEAVAPAESDRGFDRAEMETASLKRHRVVQTLSTLSNALHDLAKAIVANLKKG